MPRVYNKHHGDAPTDAVYVGRPHPLGNPYKVGPITRDQAVDSYRLWLERQIAFGNVDLEPLRGKDLVCWCAPKRCHADVILELANEGEAPTNKQGASNGNTPRWDRGTARGTRAEGSND